MKEEEPSHQENRAEFQGDTGDEKNGPIRSVLFEFDGTLAVPGAIDFKTIKRDLGCPLDQPILEHIEKQPAEKRVFLKELLEIHEEAVDILVLQRPPYHSPCYRRVESLCVSMGPLLTKTAYQAFGICG